MEIKNIVDRSGDSILCECTFSSGFLKIRLEMDELDSILFLNVLTKKIECINLNMLSEIEKNCQIELIRINDELKIENGYYVAEKSFPNFMKSCKKGFNLAYGMKSSENAYLLNIIGYERLVTCVIENISKDLEWIIDQ